MYYSAQQIRLIRFFSLFNSKTWIRCFRQCQKFKLSSLELKQESESKTLKCFGDGAESGYIQPKQERSRSQ